MTKFTNIGAVDYASKMVGLPYWYGTYGQIASSSLYNEKRKSYPSNYPPAKWTVESFTSQYGKKVHDCGGLAFKGYLMTPQDNSNYPYNTAVYNSRYDYSANGMEKLATEKGKIDTMPDIIGLLVWKNGHIGIYAGKDSNGTKWVYEAQGHKQGVTRTKISERGWQEWLKCPFFEYVVSEPTPTPAPSASGKLPTLKKGDKDTDAVESWQTLLRHYCFLDQNGAQIEIDRSFGGKTEYATKSVQKKAGLSQTGIVDDSTWISLIS